VTRQRTLCGFVLIGLTLAAPVAAAERCVVTDPIGTPLNVRRFDGKIIGALHNGEIVKILRMGADRNAGYIESSSAGTWD
jgi:hypothetical protein